MMRKRVDVLLTVAVLFVAACALTPSNARIRGGSPSSAPPAACPYTGDLANDGCLASPGGSVQYTNFFSSYAAQSGQSYSGRPDWNVAGVDYAVGVPAVADASNGICGLDVGLADIATAPAGSVGDWDPGCGIRPAGCTYKAGGEPGLTIVPTLVCGNFGSNNVVLKGFDFSLNGGVQVMLRIGSLTGTFTYAYNKCGGVNIYSAGACLYALNGQTAGIFQIANTFDLAWDTDFSDIAGFTMSRGGTGTGNGSGTNLTISGYSGNPINVGASGDRVSGTGISGTVTLLSQSSGTPGGDGVYVTSATTTIAGTTVTVSSNKMYVSACTACDIQQYMVISGLINSFVNAQDSGTPGGVGVYTTNSYGRTVSGDYEALFASQAFTLHTTGELGATYNAYLHVNGRPGGGQRQAALLGDENWKYNYIEGMVYNALQGAHGEFWQGTITSNSVNQTIPNMNYEFNTVLQPDNVAPEFTTSSFYPNTGFIASQPAGIFNTITNLRLKNNTIVTNQVPDGGSGTTYSTSMALADIGSYFFTNAEVDDNWIDNTGSIYYSLCRKPSVGGSSRATFTVNGDVTGSVLTVNTVTGTPFVAGAGQRVGSTGLHITTFGTGTGGAGTYNLDGSASVPTGTISIYTDTFTNAPSITGNFDLITATSIDGTIVTPDGCTWPGNP